MINSGLRPRNASTARRFAGEFGWMRVFQRAVRLRLWPAGSPTHVTESSSSPADWSFSSCCSPPRLTAAQLQSNTGGRDLYPKRTFTSLSVKVRSQAHWPRQLVVWAAKPQEVTSHASQSIQFRIYPTKPGNFPSQVRRQHVRCNLLR